MESLEIYNWLLNNFPSKFSFNKGTSDPTDIPPIVPSYFLNTSTEKLWFYSGNIKGWKEAGSGGNSETYEVKTSDFTVAIKTNYICDVSTITASQLLATIPKDQTFKVGDTFSVYCFSGDTSSKNIIVDFTTNGYKLEGSTVSNFIVNVNSAFKFLYISDTLGFKVIPLNFSGESSSSESILTKSADFSVSNNSTYLIDSSASAINVYVPSDITYPYKFKIIDLKNTSSTNNIIVNFSTNSYKLQGVTRNYTINTNGAIYEFIANEATFGFKPIEIQLFNNANIIKSSNSMSNITYWSYASYYPKGSRCYYCGFIAEANGDVSENTSFLWGTSGSTFKPVSIQGNWRGLYNLANSYVAGDLISPYSGSGTLYRLVGISNVNANDSSYDPSSGVNRNNWWGINNDVNQWVIGATTTLNGRQGLVPPPAIGDNNKFLKGDGTWQFPSPTGCINMYSGFTPPVGWLLCDGSIVSRTTYSDLFNTVTFTGTASPTTNSKIVTCSDTSKLCVGMVVEFNSGTWGYTIASIDSATQYSLNVVCIDMSGSQAVRYFPFGNGGNGTRDMFNLPNIKGKVVVGIDGSNEFKSMGQMSGEKSHILSIQEIPSHNHSITRATGKDNGDFDGYGGQLAANDTQNYGTIYTGYTGNSYAHNNLQPYITMNYIIKY